LTSQDMCTCAQDLTSMIQEVKKAALENRELLLSVTTAI